MNQNINIISKGLILLFTSFMMAGTLSSQTEYGDTAYNDSVIKRLQVYDSFDIPSDFQSQYRNALRRVRRVYPLALEAARVIDSLDSELENMNRNRKKNKLARKTHKALSQDFKFLLKDLYISEGIVLTKLVYRETGMTVNEIISKYKNGVEASVYTGLANFFEQDLNAQYYPNTEDFVLECVVNDIKSGKVSFDPHFKKISKTEYKEEQKASRKRKREYAKEKKERLAEKKKLESGKRGMIRK